MNSNSRISSCCVFVFSLNLICRFLVWSLTHAFPENEDNGTAYNCLSAQYHISYGAWTIYNVIYFFNLDRKCLIINDWSIYTYIIICFVGLYSATIIIGVSIILILCGPCLLYDDLMTRRYFNENHNDVGERNIELLSEE